MNNNLILKTVRITIIQILEILPTNLKFPKYKE